MSIVNPRVSQAIPASCFLKLDGQSGKAKLSFRDSDVKYEPKIVDLLILDEGFSCVQGKKPNLPNGVRSNFCYDNQDFYKVRFDNNVPIASGTWQQVKLLADGAGGKYTRVVFAHLLAVDPDDKGADMMALNKKLQATPTIVKLDLHGVAMNAFIEFKKRQKAKDMAGFWVRVSGFEQYKTKQGLTVWSPVLSGRKLKADDTREAVMIETGKALWLTEIEPFVKSVLSGSMDEPVRNATAADFTNQYGEPEEPDYAAQEQYPEQPVNGFADDNGTPNTPPDDLPF